jgi:glycerol-3-phosphate dehydrogenase
VADFDLAVIGGGINGTGIARDAAGRGFRVVLIEQNDLASGTSSASSKLIHGGLRYLEHYEFRLVREALREREVLLRLAPHLIRPLRFVLPINEARRSAMLLRIGLFIYDWIGWRKILPGTREVDLVTDEAGQPLKSRFHHAYEYSDCFADDARLVVLNAVDAAERGAVIRTRTRCVWAERNDTWRLVLNARGQRDVVTAPGANCSPRRRCALSLSIGSVSTRARTSSCQNFMITIALTFCRPSMGGWCSQSRFSATSR